MIPSWLPDSITSVPDRMIERALLWGLEALELQTVGGPSDRVPYVNEARLRRGLEASDLAVAAVVPGLFEGEADDRASWENDLVLLEESLDFCRRFSCPIVVVSSFRRGGTGARLVDALRRAGDRAARHGVMLALLNEGGMTAETGSELGDLLRKAAHPALGAAWDPAGAESAGERTADGIQAVAEHATLVRYRDGSTDWEEVFEALHARGYSGPVSLVLPTGTGRGDGLSTATEMIGRLRSVQSPRPR